MPSDPRWLRKPKFYVFLGATAAMFVTAIAVPPAFIGAFGVWVAAGLWCQEPQP